MLDFNKNGLLRFESVCSESETRQVEQALSNYDGRSAGVRLYGVQALHPVLSASGWLTEIVTDLLKAAAKPVRAVLFDKTAKDNWGLAWHQDRTIVVKERKDMPGFGSWTIKTGLQHVAPPIEILETMVTLRFHLDPVPADNAPLLAAMGSHRLGRIAEVDIEAVVSRSDIITCLANRGDVWVYSTPILHASHPSKEALRRRVLQVDFAFADLPGNLEWKGVF
ncbi:MAG: phytanoyl-CoA dioxygenase family protein [Sphingorhabdus sp.]